MDSNIHHIYHHIMWWGGVSGAARVQGGSTLSVNFPSSVISPKLLSYPTTPTNKSNDHSGPVDRMQKFILYELVGK